MNILSVKIEISKYYKGVKKKKKPCWMRIWRKRNTQMPQQVGV